MLAILLDTETTGMTDPQPVEVAWLSLGGIPTLAVEGSFCQRYRPSKPIELGAMATHGIMLEDLEGCPPASEFRLPEGAEYLIGHNVDFDWDVVKEPGRTWDVQEGLPRAPKRICTCALARRLWPRLDSHSLMALLYMIDPELARTLSREAHSAKADVLACLRILRRILQALPQAVDWSDLWACSEIARIPTHMPYGKHRGMPMSDVPRDYKDWLLRQPDVDPYLRQALRR